jgi:Tfp pilus assembly protein PilF
VQLLQVASGRTLWTGSFDEASETSFALEDAISQRMAKDLLLNLSEQEQQKLAAPHTRNGAAYDLYTQGRVLLNARSVAATQASIGLFQQAIRADPNYAAAYAGLADAYILAGSYGNSFLSPSVAAPKAEESVTRALELDESSAEAHTSLAYLRLTYDWNWLAAEAEFRRAIELNPRYGDAHHWYSHELLALERVDESHRQSEQALALDPTGVLMNEHMAWHHLFARQYFVAIAQAEKAVEIDPNFVQAHRVLGLAYLYSGDGDRACPEFATGVSLSHEDPIALAYLARCYALTHKQAQAREIVASLESAATERYISAAEIAAVHAALGDKAIALRWLGRACDERAGALIYLNIDPVFDAMRDDPAFQRIVERVGLPKMTPLVRSDVRTMAPYGEATH